MIAAVKRLSGNQNGKHRFVMVLGLLFVLWCVGQIVRDLTWLSGFLFYIPSPVLGGLALLYGADCLRKRSFRNASWAAAIAIPPHFVCPMC